MTANDVLDKIQYLPKDVQQHLYHYVEFLYKTYHSQGKGTANLGFFQAHELTESGKAFLEQRVTEASAHPEKLTDWRDARQKIHKKQNLPQ